MLEGKFGNCQVDEVLQTITQGEGTGRLVIEGTSVFGGHVRATVFVERSHIVHVEATGAVCGSLVDLFSLREGKFSFASGEVQSVRDRSVSVSDIILQVTAALDEWNSMRQQISSIDAVYALNPDGAATDLTLTGEQWQIMARLDGTASVRGIANEVGRGIVDVAKTIRGFAELGLTTENQVSAVSQDQESSKPQRRGFFSLWSRK